MSDYLIYVMRKCEHCGQDAERPITLIQLLEDPAELERVLHRESDEVQAEVDKLRDDLLYVRAQADRLLWHGVRREFVDQQLHVAETKIEEQVAKALRIQKERPRAKHHA